MTAALCLISILKESVVFFQIKLLLEYYDLVYAIELYFTLIVTLTFQCNSQCVFVCVQDCYAYWEAILLTLVSTSISHSICQIKYLVKM